MSQPSPNSNQLELEFPFIESHDRQLKYCEQLVNLIQFQLDNGLVPKPIVNSYRAFAIVTMGYVNGSSSYQNSNFNEPSNNQPNFRPYGQE